MSSFGCCSPEVETILLIEISNEYDNTSVGILIYF